MMKSFVQILFVAGLALGTGACGTLYTVDVVAFNNTDHELDKTYVLLSRSPEIDINSPEFTEYASQVQRALDSKGYRRLPGDDLTSVALGVYLAANVGDPGKQYHTVTSGIYESPYAENSTSSVRSSGNNTGGQRPPTPPPAPSPEVLTGYEEASFGTTVYTKYLSLVAIDLQQYLRDIAAKGWSDATPAEVWSVDIQTTGKPAELREAAPVMVAAAQPYITGRTDRVVRIKISAVDKRVRAIQGNL